MKRYAKLILIVGIALTVLSGCLGKTQEEPKTPETPSTQDKQAGSDKVYVALEEDGAVAVIDVQSKQLAKKIRLDGPDGEEFMAHNIQVSPDRKSVWVTANAMEKDMHASRLVPPAVANEGAGESSELVVIDPLTDIIVQRIALGTELELAHVVLTPDSARAVATSQKTGAVFVVDTATREIVKKIELDQTSEPHGVRISPDGRTAYVALLKGNGMAAISLQSFEVTQIQLQGKAVQTAVTPNGQKVIATLYDTKKLAVYAVGDQTIQEIALPEGARGPLQLYPTSDSRFVYVADQGYYFKEPEGEKVYKVDLETAQIVAEIKAGSAPHGIVISPDDAYVFVTNLRSNDVSVIDAATAMEVAKIKVGKAPNGISYWSAN